jgi:hypothetical protein
MLNHFCGADALGKGALDRIAIGDRVRSNELSVGKTVGAETGSFEKSSECPAGAGGPGRTRTCNQTVMSGRL